MVIFSCACVWCYCWCGVGGFALIVCGLNVVVLLACGVISGASFDFVNCYLSWRCDCLFYCFTCCGLPAVGLRFRSFVAFRWAGWGWCFESELLFGDACDWWCAL